MQPCYRPRSIRWHSVQAAASHQETPLPKSQKRQKQQYRVRQATEHEAPQVALVCAKVFGPMAFQSFPTFVKVPSTVKEQAEREIYKDVDFQLRRALKLKKKATQEAREFKLSQISAALRRELAQLSGGPAFRSSASRIQTQALKRWSRSRQFVCLVAETFPSSSSPVSPSEQAPDNQKSSASPISALRSTLVESTESSLVRESANKSATPSNGSSLQERRLGEDRGMQTNAYSLSDAANPLYMEQASMPLSNALEPYPEPATSTQPSFRAAEDQSWSDSSSHGTSTAAWADSFPGMAGTVSNAYLKSDQAGDLQRWSYAVHASADEPSESQRESDSMSLAVPGSDARAEQGHAMIDSREPETVGCAVLSILAPEAILPPPFPSSSPLRCCISNLATLSNHRQQGVATMLVKQCERIARRWGFEDVWLHTDVSNTTAQACYKACGFVEHKRDPVYLGPFRRILLRKSLQPLPSASSRRPKTVEIHPSKSPLHGAYRWNVSEED